jgi:hypothetical protein
MPIFIYALQIWNKYFFCTYKFKVSQSVHHHTFQINQPTKYNNFSSLLLEVYVQFNMFRVLPLECGGSSTVGRGRAAYNRPDHDQ